MQNNFHGEPPQARTKAMPGTPDKIERMRRRAALGEDLTREDDGPEKDLS